MNILWLTNKVIPVVDKARGQEVHTVNEGWISQMFDQIITDSRFNMNIICMGCDDNKSGNTISYSWHVIKTGLKEEIYYSYDIQDYFVRILNNCKPDVIHIWGSEYPHTLAMVNAAEIVGILDRVVISLQGIMYMCAEHYLNGVPAEIVNNKTFYDLLRHNSLKNQQKRFEIRGKSELEAFKKIFHVIGRTTWDKYCVERINPNVNYHHCNETLRAPFYDGNWEYSRCRRHSIFISQATYPIKGMHYFLRALPLLVKKYPDLLVCVAGNDITKTTSLFDKLKLSSYGVYLRRMIKENNLDKHFKFLGRLDAVQMKEQYLSANVFVSSSLIENSPNSVGEAMLLGCPVVSSNVGGVSSIIEHGKEGYTYPVDEYCMLEYYISKIFDLEDRVECLASKAKMHAMKTHGAIENYECLTQIYNEIAK